MKLLALCMFLGKASGGISQFSDNFLYSSTTSQNVFTLDNKEDSTLLAVAQFLASCSNPPYGEILQRCHCFYPCSLHKSMVEKYESYRMSNGYRPFLAVEYFAKFIMAPTPIPEGDLRRLSLESLTNTSNSLFLDSSPAPTPWVFNQLTGIEVAGICLIAIACTVAVCVGVGGNNIYMESCSICVTGFVGGGMFVPILILMLGFTTHQSTAISQALMVGGTLAGLLLNWNQKHPSCNRPLIDVLLVGCIYIYIYI